MGVSYLVKGVRDLDKRFSDMAKVKKACDDAEIGYPDEVYAFFEGDDYDVADSIECLRSNMETFEIPVEEKGSDGEVIYEVSLSDLPDDTKAVRFIIGY